MQISDAIILSVTVIVAILSLNHVALQCAKVMPADTNIPNHLHGARFGVNGDLFHKIDKLLKLVDLLKNGHLG